MTKDNKFKIAMALHGIAMLLDDASFNKVKDRLKTIEEIYESYDNYNYWSNKIYNWDIYRDGFNIVCSGRRER